MNKTLKTLLIALVAVAAGASFAPAQDAPLISPAQLHKMLKFLDTQGGKETFPPPVAQNLGLSDDPNKALPITVLVTDDHKVYFCRSELNRNDFILWVRMPDNVSSYMILTHADFKAARALLLRNDAFPEQQDAQSKKLQTIFKDALTGLSKDVDKSLSP